MKCLKDGGPPGWGGGTASLKVGTHCQTTTPAFWPCPPLSFLWPPPVFEGHRPPPPKIRHPQYKISYKTDPKYFSKLSIQWIPCISQNRVKTNTSYKLLPLLGSQFEVDRPPFLPLKGLTAPRFCRSPPPLRAAVWQWVVIQYLSAPPPGVPSSHGSPSGTAYGHNVKTYQLSLFLLGNSDEINWHNTRSALGRPTLILWFKALCKLKHVFLDLPPSAMCAIHTPCATYPQFTLDIFACINFREWGVEI